MWIQRIAAMLVAAALAACASGPRVVDADVQTQVAQPPGASVLKNARFHFERGTLTTGTVSATDVESMAQAALARVGVVRDDAAPTVSVKVTATVNADWCPPRELYGFWGYPGWAWSYGWYGWGWHYYWPTWDADVPTYVSEVALLMRDVQSGQIVYDTRARHEGGWSDTRHVIAALLAAALEGYPQPGKEFRRVDVPLLQKIPADRAESGAIATPHAEATPHTEPVRTTAQP